MARTAAVLIPALLWAGALSVRPAPAAEPLPRHRVTLGLPGPPSKVITTDLDGDGVDDLVVVLVYTEYEELAFDRVEGFLQMTEIVPALAERREVRAWLGRPEGGFRSAGPPLDLPAEVTALGPGPPGAPLVALTGSGASALVLESGPGSALALRPLVPEAPVLRGSRDFLPGLEIVEDLDGDGVKDLLFPARDGLAVFRGTEEGFRLAASDRLTLPGDRQGRGAVAWRRYPIPRREDVDGDGLLDLVVGDRGGRSGRQIHILRGLGTGRFAEPVPLDLGDAVRPGDGESFELLQLGDLDGRPGAELALYRELGSEEDGMAEAKRPEHEYRIHRLAPGFKVAEEPWSVFEAQGHPFSGDLAGWTAVPFRDLDGDGLKELVTVNLDFSVFQVLRVLTTKKFGMGLEFNIYAQEAGGAFRRVEDLKLEDKILLNLDDLKLNRLGNFAGDFDGDGRLEFMTLEGGRDLRIHMGTQDCAYARKADYEIRLEEEPPDPGLVQVADLDGDGEADLFVTRPLEPDPTGATSPVALDLYLSRGAR